MIRFFPRFSSSIFKARGIRESKYISRRRSHAIATLVQHRQRSNEEKQKKNDSFQFYFVNFAIFLVDTDAPVYRCRSLFCAFSGKRASSDTQHGHQYTQLLCFRFHDRDIFERAVLSFIYKIYVFSCSS